MRLFGAALILMLCCTASVGQTFTIKGTIDADSGQMLLLNESGPAYYSCKRCFDAVPVNKGTFEFQDSLGCPSMFLIGWRAGGEWKYLSGEFMVEPGVQVIHCDKDSMREIPAIDNAGTKELRVWLNALPYRRKDSAAAAIYRQEYVKTHPDSYVALWDLIGQLEGGDAATFDPLYQAFSDKVRNSYPGRVLAEKLAAAKSIAIGRPFPAATLPGPENQPISLSQVEGRSRYTLIDFWFSHCGACIGQFPFLIKVYEKYRAKGFEMIGVSTDPEKAIKAWKAAIRQNHLPWQQCLDMGGKLAYRLSIVTYPTNFLVDEKGVIVKKNLNSVELDRFLAENINQ
jgi:peroxiredoxin